MTRHLMFAGLLLGLSGAAYADTADDAPLGTPDAEASAADGADIDQEVAAKSGRGRSGGGGKPSASRSSSGSRPPSHAARPASSGARAAPPPSRTSSARPATAARPAPTSSARHATPAAARPSSARPPTAARPAPTSAARHAPPAAARPTHRVYHAHWAPDRWAPSYHRYHIRGVPHYSPRYWSAGVFVYNPPPRHHRVVVVDRSVSGQRVSKTETEPTRAVDRSGDFGIGITAGSFMSGYDGGGGYGDLGLGVVARFRPVEAVGLEVSYAQHSQTFDETSERINEPFQTSVQLYAFPWTRVSPYVSAGLTWNTRSLFDDYYNADAMRYELADVRDTAFGPHAGLGMEFAIGDSAALNVEGRYIGYLNQIEGDPSSPNAVQGTMGLNFYF